MGGGGDFVCVVLFSLFFFAPLFTLRRRLHQIIFIISSFFWPLPYMFLRVSYSCSLFFCVSSLAELFLAPIFSIKKYK